MVTNYGEGGGATKWEEAGASEDLPLQKGEGVVKVLAMLKGGRTSFEVVFPRKFEVLAILKGWGGGAQIFSPS